MIKGGVGIRQSFRRPLLISNGTVTGVLPSEGVASGDDSIYPLENVCPGTVLLTQIGFDNLYSYADICPACSYVAFGQSFQGDGSTLSCALVMLRKEHAPTGSIFIKLYAHTGTYGSTGVPTGTALATSAGINSTTLTSSYYYYFDSFTTPYVTTAGTNYFLTVEYSGTGGEVILGVDNRATTVTSGNGAYKVGTTWTATTSLDMCFSLFGTFRTILTEAAFSTYDVAANGDQYNYIAGTGENTRIAQSFTGITGNISKVTVSLRKTGSPTGNITAVLYAHTGTFGTTGTPTGTALATSDVLSAASVSTTETPYTLTFSGANQFSMTAGTNYWISLEFSGGNTSNKIGVVMDISSPTAPGRAAYYNGTTWGFTTGGTGTSGASDDMCHILYALS